MALHFAPPEALHGSVERQAAQIYRYLFRMSEQLNSALAAVEKGATTGVVQAIPAAAGAASSTTAAETTTDAYNNLKSLIIKNADTVVATMDEMRETFATTYLAQSEFGTFQSNLASTITTTAEGLLLDLDYDSQLDAVDAALAGFASYQTTTQQYIKIGVVRYNDDGTSEAGVVVGKNLSEVEIDGKTIVTSSNMYSCFTATELSFWKNGVKQAYFSNETLYVNAVSTNTVRVGSWQIDRTNGFSIKWVG